MISIFDNLTAIMIFGVVLLILLAIQSRSLGESGELLSMYSGKVASLDLARLLEADMDIVGDGITQDSSFFSTALFTAPVQDGVLTREFVFNQVLPKDSLSFMGKQHRYRLVDESTIMIDTHAVQTYRLIREDRTDSTGIFTLWEKRWESYPLLTYFNITMTDENFVFTSHADSAKYLKIAFSGLLPHQRSEHYMRELNWNTTNNVRPF